MKPHLKKARQKLKATGHKLTKQRLAILEILIGEWRPYTVEEIHHKLGKEHCDLVTVYRNLELFLQCGLIKPCHFGDGLARYEFMNEEGHHHHIICKQCKKFEDFDTCFVKELERMVAEKGYQDISHSLEFYALCPACIADS